jgi:hypothetical protein
LLTFHRQMYKKIPLPVFPGTCRTWEESTKRCLNSPYFVVYLGLKSQDGPAHASHSGFIQPLPPSRFPKSDRLLVKEKWLIRNRVGEPSFRFSIPSFVRSGQGGGSSITWPRKAKHAVIQKRRIRTSRDKTLFSRGLGEVSILLKCDEVG